MFVTLFIVLSICYVTVYYFYEYAECESERQTLIASIAKLRTASLDNTQLYR